MTDFNVGQVTDKALGDILALSIGIDRKVVALRSLHDQCLRPEQIQALDCIITKYEALAVEKRDQSKSLNEALDKVRNHVSEETAQQLHELFERFFHLKEEFKNIEQTERVDSDNSDLIENLRQGADRHNCMLNVLNEEGLETADLPSLTRIVENYDHFHVTYEKPQCAEQRKRPRKPQSDPTMEADLERIESLLGEGATGEQSAFLHCAKKLLEYTRRLRQVRLAVEGCYFHGSHLNHIKKFETFVLENIKDLLFTQKESRFFASDRELRAEQRRYVREKKGSTFDVSQELKQDYKNDFLFNTLAGFLAAASCFEEPQAALDELYKARGKRRYAVPFDPADLIDQCASDLEVFISKEGRVLKNINESSLLLDSPEYVARTARGSTDAGGGRRNIRKSEGL